MEKEQMISKMDDFLLGYDYLDGFTAYMAYCCVFGIDFDYHILIDSEDMSFADFREWLSLYIYEYKDDFRQINIFGRYDDVYVKKE